MKILYNKIEYSVYWKYIRFEDVRTTYMSEYTECYIESLTNQIISRATKTPPDQFNKEIGRKLSFARALQLLFPSRKDARKFFWHCYFEFTNQLDKIDEAAIVARMNNRFAEIL